MKHFSIGLLIGFLVISCSTYESNSLTNPNNTGQNDLCSMPSALTVSTFSSSSSLEVSWTPGATESTWQLEFGLHGFTHGQGSTILVNTVSHTTINGLNPASNYDFYLRAKCEQNGFSSWVGPVSIGGALAQSAYFKMKNDGQPWIASGWAANFSGSIISITGNRSVQNDRVSFSFAGNSAGTYPGSACMMAYTPVATNSDSYTNLLPVAPYTSSGSLTITSIDTVNRTLSGTFAFDGYKDIFQSNNFDTKQFTQGEFFKIPYTDNGTGNNTFFTKINGTEFVDVNIISITASGGSSTTINIDAFDAVNNKVIISFDDSLTPGTYPINFNPSSPLVQMSYELGTTTLQATIGSLTITSITADTAIGTFSFSTTDPVTSQLYNFSEGAFTVHF
ncbi:MAG: hypothetical protein CFE24_12545 [Flavobacterium sp. BFFFF2]|nr:MAG: hypothetical protein CFE24_12545 [Flavobacterium sp. BFFFF2]